MMRFFGYVAISNDDTAAYRVYVPNYFTYNFLTYPRISSFFSFASLRVDNIMFHVSQEGETSLCWIVNNNKSGRI